jgi:hypothetical protein
MLCSHCFLLPDLAHQLEEPETWTSAVRGGPLAVRQAYSQAPPTQVSVEVLLTLGALEGHTLFTIFDLDCDADVILGFPRLRSTCLIVVYEGSQVCFCAEDGCTSGLGVRMDLAQASATTIPLCLGGQPRCR